MPSKTDNSHFPTFQYPMIENEIDLSEVLSAIWRGKWIVVITTILFAILSVLYAINKPNIYRADVLLAPADSSGGNAISKMAGQLGGLASIAGVNLGGAEANQTELAVQVLQSRLFIDKFITNHDLLVPIMASTGWNMATNELLIDESVFDSSENAWVREPQGLRGKEPSSQEAYEVFMEENLSLHQDKDTGFYRLSIMHYSPFLAQAWANLLVTELNDEMRLRAISDANKNLKYLKEQLQNTSVSEMQSTFYSLIEEQTKSLMLAKTQDEFSFKVIDPAVAPEIKAQPKRALICILGTLLGTILGITIVLIMFAYKKNEKSDSNE
ncbi:LPS O-antigen length regulator [Vibrio campbellii]|uniref:Wzz/FepE/Etk N-terminal domain-containing protein n=1 Tax=Vibrio campbellii TaxID=680 RepID=UPI000CF42E37|nr:Wzz/FepE/Etk N-terminal domain-containing protein [Vibrio campbellii]PQJ44926.1 LPS O-antigen length regulator [Vibrio campbellii]